MEKILADLRTVPLRYFLLATFFAVMIYQGNLNTGFYPFRSLNNEPAIASGAALVRLFGVGLALAPLLALRWAIWPVVLCLPPLAISALSERQFSFTVFMALLGVAMVGTWPSPRRALVPATLAVGLIVPLVAGTTTMLVPYGAVIMFGGVVDADASDRLIVLGMYAVVTALAFAAAMWLRSSALSAQKESSLNARSAAVEDEAAVIGERARLARDLHDVVAHHVSLIAVRAETAPYTYPDLPPQARVVLSDIAVDARTALDELRGVLGILRRSDDHRVDRSPQPGLSDIAELVERSQLAGTGVSLHGDLDRPMGKATSYVAYRVVQEALTNARRHAPGQPVEVSVSGDGERLVVRVLNPCGATPEGVSGGHRGLAGMRERVEALNGVLVAERRGEDFVVEATLPEGDV